MDIMTGEDQGGFDMVIKLWDNFTKKRNSTLQPYGGITKNVILKEETSIERPSFILAEPVANWTYVQAFGRFYFVTDVINLDGHRSEIVCDVDYLATYKPDILGYTAFVERASSYYDEYVNDPLLSSRQLMIRDDHYITALTNFFNVTGCYVVQVMNKNDGVILMAMDDLSPINKILMPATYTTTDIQNWIDSKIAQAFDLDVYIGTIKWVPFTASSLSNLTTNELAVGPLGVNLGAVTLHRVTSDKTYKHIIAFLTLPTSGFFGDFRDTNDTFTQYTLSLPGVGFVPLNADFVGSCIKTGMQISIDIFIDLVSGDVTYDISSYEAGQVNYKGPFAQFKGNVSVDVPIGKSSGHPIRTATTYISGLAGGGGSAAAGNVVSGAATIFSSQLEAISNNIRPQVSMMGGNGNKADMRNHTTITLTRRQYGAKDYPTAVAGRPLMQNVLLGNLSGYVKCGNASVPLNAQEVDMTAVNNFLNSGFYIE